MAEGGAGKDSACPMEGSRRPRHVAQDCVAPSVLNFCKLGKLGMESCSGSL
jgi:hypothetical protein